MRFTLDDQKAFSALSQDYNPIHVDQVAARRLIYGQPVVHGINVLLWALREWSKHSDGPIRIEALKCKFLKPVVLDEEVTFTFSQGGKNQIKFDIQQFDVVVSKIQFTYLNADYPYTPLKEKDSQTSPSPLQRALGEMASLSGNIDLSINPERVLDMYGASFLETFGALQIAELLALTRIVGMHAPGMNSLFSEIILTSHDGDKNQSVSFNAVSFDERFHLLTLNTHSPLFKGILKTFYRPQHVQQNTTKALKKSVQEDEFSDQRALIIGGSRGIGEVTAKLLAAGGASVLLTYHQGENDAHAIVDDILQNDFKTDLTCCNILDLSEETTQKIVHFCPSHVYYYPTPFIFNGVKGVFSENKYHHFLKFYVDGFNRVINLTYSLGVRHFFYPSTVAVEEIPADMCEYSLAKISGEAFCEIQEKVKPDIVIFKPRLPRIATDQTVSLMAVDNQEALTILPHLRSFHKRYLSHG